VIRIGLTGGIASGKSAAARILHEFGAVVIDADAIVAALYVPGAPGAAAVERLFGPEMLDAGGAVAKPALAKLAFDDPGSRRRLEEAIHPLVLAEIRRRFAEAERAGATAAVAEASQLLEGGYRKEFDRVLLVVAPPPLRLERAQARGLAPAEAERRIAAQMAEEEARPFAHDVVENAGTVEELREKLGRLYRSWIEGVP
jgi:dephospho-CoA kinase